MKVYGYVYVGCATLVLCFAASGCSSSSGSEQGASGDDLNSSNAKVLICDQETEGCDPCSKKIGDHELDEQERAACTLKGLRGVLKDRVRFLIGQAGNAGVFLRSVASTETPVRLTEIKVAPAVDRKAREDVFTRLAGTFTVGEDSPSPSTASSPEEEGNGGPQGSTTTGGSSASGAEGGVAIHSVRMAVNFSYIFEDATSGTVFDQVLTMKNTYDLIPFFYTKANVGLKLSLGSILSAFTGQPGIASTLLSTLGGNARLELAANQELRWTTPVCADTASKPNDRAVRAFDVDFYLNVLKPMCEQYKKDRETAGQPANVTCDFSALVGDVKDAQTFLEETTSALGNRTVLPVRACTKMNNAGSLLDARLYKLDFAAPERWGFAADHEAWLYERDLNSSNVWHKKNWVRVLGTDSGVSGRRECGGKPLEDGDVCVHAEVRQWYRGDTLCAKASSSSTGAPEVGIAQSEGMNRISYQIPELR